MLKSPPWFANIPPCLALVDKSSGRYYLTQVERREDVIDQSIMVNVAGGVTTVLENTDITLRTCDALVHLDLKLKIIPSTNDGLAWDEISDIYRSTVQFVQNNDPFQTIDMTVEEVLAQDVMDGGVARRNAAGAFLGVPGVPSHWSATPYYYPPILLHRDNRTVNFITPATANLAAITFRIDLLHVIMRISSSPQNQCGYTIAACDESGRPAYEMIGPRGPGLSVSSRIESAGLVPPGLPAEADAATPHV